MSVFNTNAKDIMKPYIDKILAEKSQLGISYHNYNDIAILVNIGTDNLCVYAWQDLNPEFEHRDKFPLSGNLGDEFESKEEAITWAITNNHVIYSFDLDISKIIFEKFEETRKSAKENK